MRRVETVLLHSPELPFERLQEVLSAALEAVGVTIAAGRTDAELVLVDRRDEGSLAYVDDVALARRLARALATRAPAEVRLFEVVGTAGQQRSRFRTEAFRALASGELRPAEGTELDLEDAAQTWGGGELEAQAAVVLLEFSGLERRGAQTVTLGLRKRPAAKASSPRVSELLGRLKHAKSHTATLQPDGRYELRMELAAGGTQTSYCSGAEYEELAKLLGR